MYWTVLANSKLTHDCFQVNRYTVYFLSSVFFKPVLLNMFFFFFKVHISFWVPFPFGFKG